MHKEKQLLVINVGSTSTKAAFFSAGNLVCQETIQYSSEELGAFKNLKEQLPRREEDLLHFTEKYNIKLDELNIVVSRGGLGKPSPAGAYGIDKTMCHDLLTGKYGTHPSALGPAMALDMAEKCGIQAIVIDPPSTDEFQPLARISGIPNIERKSAFHALNQKAAARKTAREIGTAYEEINLIVAHLGGGITIGVHEKGKVIDCTHGLSEGPFTPERAGSLPSMKLLDLAFSGEYTRNELQRAVVGKGGLAAYLFTSDALKIEKMILFGNEYAKLIFETMIYQIAKDIGAMATVLSGAVEGVVITGGLAYSERLTEGITKRVTFLAPVFVYPGEDEMTALAEGALRILNDEEEIKNYA